MKKIVLLFLFALALTTLLWKTTFAAVPPPAEPSGELLYKKHCSGCHHDGAKLKRVKDIVYTMRNPPAVMPKFDGEKVPDRSAEEIARYIHEGPAAARPTPPQTSTKKKAAQRRQQGASAQ